MLGVLFLFFLLKNTLLIRLQLTLTYLVEHKDQVTRAEEYLCVILQTL